MRTFRPLLLLGISAAVCVLPLCVSAQEETGAAPQDNPTDAFPDGGTQTPAAATPNRSRGGRRNAGGARSKGGRRHEMLLGQADMDPLEVRVAYRRAKTVALARDPGLATLLHEADSAPDDVVRRGILKEYYARLFASVRKIDPSPGMKSHVGLLSRIAAQRYDPKRREVGDDEDLVNGRGGGRRGRVR